MKQSIINQFTAVLDKYDLNHGDDGVMENLNAWQTNKRNLLDILRKHENWNEDELAIVFEVEEARVINHDIVSDYFYSLKTLRRNSLPEVDDDQLNFVSSINAIRDEYSKTIVYERTAHHVKTVTKVNCVVGQKTSRVVKAICKKFGVDKLDGFTKIYAELADALNPLAYKRKATLSVHPCDYLEMSNKDNNWSSCHCLDDGGWRAGTLSYMNDDCSMIFSTIDNDAKSKFHAYPKVTRQVFAYKYGILLQSRLYPYTYDDILRDNYRNVVQMAFSKCLDTPNLWTFSKDRSVVDNRVRSYNGSMHYRDYAYSDYRANISLLNSENVPRDKYVTVGWDSYCLSCGSAIYSPSYMNCDDCNDSGHRSCPNCNSRHREEDMHFVNGDWYCENCCSFCEHCEEYVTDDVTPVTNRRGDTIYVCEDCLCNYERCVHCDDYFEDNQGQFIDDDFVCDSCIENFYTPCADCGELVPNEAVERVGDGLLYCAECAEGQLEDSEVEAGDEAEEAPVAALEIA